jgi:hypothetical protein
VTVARNGECTRLTRRQMCPCTSDVNPVCATNGVIYANRCQADCAGYRVDPTNSCRVATQLPVFPSRREGGCSCTYEIAPVCDTKGNVWANKCTADCMGIETMECEA